MSACRSAGITMLLAWGAGACLAVRVDALPASGAPSPPASAQTAPSDRFTREDQQIRRQASLRLARAALLELRAISDPSPRDFRIAALGISIAAAIDPQNQELARRALDAWHGADDQDRLLAAIERVVRLDPADTVAQLRLVSARLSRIQEAEARLAAYDRLLGDAGRWLDVSVRSKLALDGALLARERGDEKGFAERITLATQLDSTNKDAALLAASFHNSRSTDPLGRVEVLVNALLADPTDHESHDALADELLRQGAFTAGLRFRNNAERLRNAEGIQTSTERLARSIHLSWQAEGAEQALSTIAEIEGRLRLIRETTIQQFTAAGLPPGRPLEKTYLPSQIESIRMAINLSMGRQESAEASMRSVIAELEESVADLKLPQPEGAPPIPPELEPKRMQELRLGSMWVRLWVGVQIDEAEATLAEAETAGDVTGDEVTRYRGWVALRRGRTTEAREMLTPLAEAGDPQARLGLAYAAETDGDTRAAVGELARLALNRPDGVLGAFARRRIEFLRNEPLAMTESAAKVAAYAADLPKWIDDFSTNPRSSAFVGVEHVKNSILVTDPLEVKVSIRNVSRIPLSFGPGRAISSRVMLTPDLKCQTAWLFPAETIQPEIAELDRRLRLLPSESVQTTFWIGQGKIGDGYDSLLASATLRWRATLNFVSTKDGKLAAGPTSITSDSMLQTRASVPPPALKPEDGGTMIASAQGESLLNAILFLRGSIAMSNGPAPVAEITTGVKPLMEAAAARMKSMSELERVFTTMVLGRGVKADQCAPVLAAAAQDTSPLVRLARLMVAAPPPDDAGYADVIDRGEPDVSELARLLRDRAAEAAAGTESAKAGGSAPGGAEPTK